MNDIKIVEFDYKYAESLADMWSKSGDSWGGESVIHTAESVMEEEKNAGNIHSFLALHNNDVVGYCSFSNYKEDEGASYIPLLNVRPDYHGKGVGKKLVLTCVAAAINSKWPRLDLYTWQGNEKAVPLYKKCGFFWEKYDEYTHLMNFLPYVKKTEAVAQYFNTIDWYKDSTREIKVESDGNIEGDFHFYKYSWQKNDLMLSMEFERKGRGLTCIETNDYLVKVRLAEQKLVFGKEYDITYELVNKSGKPLNIKIKGVDNKNIKYSADLSFSIKNKQQVVSKFFIEPIKHVQQALKTHPCVTSIININGKESVFKIGVNPKRPIEIEVANANQVKQLNKENKCYINLENNFNEDIEINFSLKDTDNVSFINAQQVVKLNAKQKKSLLVNCIVKKYSFYNEDFEVNIKTQDNNINYLANCKTVFRGYSGVFHGESDKAYELYNGAFCARLMKANNATNISKLATNSTYELSAAIPRLGKPYYNEFKSKKPIKVEFITKSTSEIIKATFKSEKFANVIMHYYIELFQDGIIKLYCDLENKSSIKDLYVTQDCKFLLIDAYLPYNGEVINSKNFEGILLKQWDINKFSENWVFNNTKVKAGLSWHDSCNVSFDNIVVMIESKVNSSYTTRTKPIIYTMDSFNSWQQFRSYLGYENPLSSSDVSDSFMCKINNNNPFITDKIILECEQHKKLAIEGKLSVSSKYNCFTQSNSCTEFKFNNNKAVVNKSIVKKPELDILSLDFSLNFKKMQQEKLLFFKNNTPVKQLKHNKGDNTVYEVSNEHIVIKSSPEYAPGIYSIIYKGKEWFNNSFPTPSIKGWWNYWTGGTSMLPGNISYASVHNEQKSAGFIEVTDIFGNVWSGVKTCLEITEHDKYKGLTITEYYLLLSGIPIVCSFAVINQNAGKYFSKLNMVQKSFIQQADIANNSIIYTDNGQKAEFSCGNLQYEIQLKNILQFKSKTTDYSLYRVINTEDLHWFSNTNLVSYSTNYSSHSVNDGETFTTKPQFMLFSKENLTEDMLNDLNKLKFKI
ncbi:GNAT family N-acetyltransferase [Clostridium sp. 'deep sea']|uniref:GNAT family N-acetyltransferase n=1 Tax=Clostridium sp. 'deep sea' TaxID=2779445 RepID=UPI0018965826|nr:GNAT family N-acetyltransferase [Clostridium sp. 'deep sea']QOR36794.1 GNAT family N-acetyltransferase [Clostridium sp. 'deep sea']